MLEMMTSKITIDFNVLSSFMKNRVVSNLNRSLVLQYIGVGWEWKTLKYASNQHNQIISLVVDFIAQYSVFVENWETIGCLLLLHEIRKSPKKIQKLVTNLRYVGSLSWSTLEYARNSKKRWMKVKDSKRLYPKDITKYKEQLLTE